MGSTHGIALALALAAASSGCIDSERHEVVGRNVYLRHCASCHGMEGRGDGPLAETLKTPPTDLTLIAARSGRFDENVVLSTIDGRRRVAEHGPREMPVWGVVFEEEQKGPFQVYAGIQQSRSLVDYLRSIQRDAPAEGAPAGPGGAGTPPADATGGEQAP